MATKAVSDLFLVRRLLAGARAYWPHIVMIVVIDMLATPIALLVPLPLKIVVDSVLEEEAVPGFLAAILPQAWLSTGALLAIAIGLLIATGVLTQVQSVSAQLLRTYAGGKLVLAFRTQLFRHAQRLSLAYHDTKGVSHTLYRVQYDTAAVEDVLINGLIPMVASIFTVAAMLYVTAQINIQLAGVALVIAPVIIVLAKVYRRPLRKGWRKQKKLDFSAMSVVNEVFSSLRVVKAYSQEGREESRYTGRATQSLRAKLQATVLQGSFDIGSALATSLGTAAVLFMGVRTIQNGAMTVGDLLIVMTYLGLLYTPLKTIGRRMASLQSALASAERAFALIDERPDVPEKPDAVELAHARGEICFEAAEFAYSPHERILESVNLQIPAGSRVGIIGRTGAGKSTLLGLLMRFYDPTGGRVLLDGRDIRDYRLEDLRRQFAMVLQDTILFSTTVRENIAYARPEASDAEIFEAAKAAHAHEFIEELPDGYQTLVGDRGMRLSGGERQRLALARAFLRDAPILLLDEPTSALDTKTESAVMAVLEELMAGRTTFIVAHRLSTVADVDYLFELRDGQLTRAELKPQGVGAA